MAEFALSLFGKTAGLEIVTFPKGKRTPDSSWIGISAADVSLKPDADVLLIRRDRSQQETVTWIGIYRKAYEIGGVREGSFFGAGVWLFDSVADGGALLAVLRHLVAVIERFAIRDGSFALSLSDIESKVGLPDVKESLLNPLHASLRSLASPPPLVNESVLPTMHVECVADLDHSPGLPWFLDWVQAEADLLGLSSRLIVATFENAFGHAADDVFSTRRLIDLQAARHARLENERRKLADELGRCRVALDESKRSGMLFAHSAQQTQEALQFALRDLLAGADLGILAVREKIASAGAMLGNPSSSMGGSDAIEGDGRSRSPRTPSQPEMTPSASGTGSPAGANYGNPRHPAPRLRVQPMSEPVKAPRSELRSNPVGFDLAGPAARPVTAEYPRVADRRPDSWSAPSRSHTRETPWYEDFWLLIGVLALGLIAVVVLGFVVWHFR